MAFTPVQTLRRLRAKNKGLNRKLAADLRIVADMLDKLGPEGFSRKQIVALQTLREALNVRLYTNALAETTPKQENGKFTLDLNPKDL